jgi:hypothetical protein
MRHFVRSPQPARTGSWSADIGKREGRRGWCLIGGMRAGPRGKEGEGITVLPRRDEKTSEEGGEGRNSILSFSLYITN